MLRGTGIDVLTEPKDGGRVRRVRMRSELAEQVAHLESLLEVTALVHIDRLESLAAREDDRVVLVLGLAFAEHDVAGQLHTEHLLHHRVALGVAHALDEHRIETDGFLQSSTPVRLGHLGERRRLVHVRNAQRWIALEQQLAVRRLELAILLLRAVCLARDDVLELQGHGSIELVTKETFPRSEETERALVQHHPLDGPRKRLAAERGPKPELFEQPLLGEEARLALRAWRHAHALEKVAPLLLVHLMGEAIREARNQRPSGAIRGHRRPSDATSAARPRAPS